MDGRGAAAERVRLAVQAGRGGSSHKQLQSGVEVGELHIPRTGSTPDGLRMLTCLEPKCATCTLGSHHPPTSILVRLPPRTATKRAPPQCLVHLRILTPSRHTACSDSPEAAGRQLSGIPASICDTHQHRAAHVWSCDLHSPALRTAVVASPAIGPSACASERK